VDSSALLPTKDGASDEDKGRDVKTSRRARPRDQVPQRGEGRHSDHQCWRTLGHSPCCTQKAKWATQAHNQRCCHPASTRCFDGAALRRTSPGAPGEVSGPMSGTPAGTIKPSVQVDKPVPPGKRRNKTPLYVSGVGCEKIPRLGSREARQARGPDEERLPHAGARDGRWVPGHY
jgi:hypothetical protein